MAPFTLPQTQLHSHDPSWGTRAGGPELSPLESTDTGVRVAAPRPALWEGQRPTPRAPAPLHPAFAG